MSDIVEVNVRDLRTVENEISVLVRQAKNLTVAYAIEIGRRLHEAKSLLDHGEWGKWLAEKTEFSQRTANNLMKLCEEYADRQITLLGAVPNSQAIANLTLTKAIRLLALPEEEREAFVEEHDVDAMTTRELETAIAEKKNAEKHAEELAAEIKKMKAVADQRQAEKIELAKKLKDAEGKAAEKAKAEIENGVKAAREETRRALAERKAALDEKHALEEELAEARRASSMNDPDVAEFKVMFEQVQDDVTKLYAILARVERKDGETAAKLKKALAALAGKIGGGNG